LFFQNTFPNTIFSIKMLRRQAAVATEGVMSANKELRHTHGHMMWVGVVGVAAGAALMIYVPSLKAVSSVFMLFAAFHLVGALVLIASVYVMGADKFARRFVPRLKRDSGKFDFGWAPAFKLGPWIAALALAAAAVALQVAQPACWPIAMLLTLLAASFFAGGRITGASGSYDNAVLPMVDLLARDRLSDDEGVVLDAGCGAGRTTVALGRALSKSNIVALDRFDSDYIEGGGRFLLEQNLRRAGLTERVRIECGDLTAMPFPDRSFDAAVSAHAVDHLGAQTEQGLRETLRVLKPGGRFLLIVWVPGWTMFAVANVLALFLAPKETWRRMATNVGFELGDEGMFNGSWFAVLKRPEQLPSQSAN
jgi:SAM-dependent methyltransferase